MFDLSEDYIFVRRVEVMSYFATTYILLWLHFQWLAGIYLVVAFSIAFSDDAVDEMHEDDVDTWFLVEQDLSTIAEREGFLLNDEDILDLLQNAYEDPILPLSYKLVDSYSRFFLENKKKNHIFVTNYDYNVLGVSDINYDILKNFAKHKLTISRQFEIEYYEANQYRKYELVKYKSIGLIMNEYLLTSFFYTRNISY